MSDFDIEEAQIDCEFKFYAACPECGESHYEDEFVGKIGDTECHFCDCHFSYNFDRTLKK